MRLAIQAVEACTAKICVMCIDCVARLQTQGLSLKLCAKGGTPQKHALALPGQTLACRAAEL
eukprot:6388356-Amphidinium_carterae.1